MRVFVAGGTGFVGRELVSQLLAGGHRVVALVRPGSEGKLAGAKGLQLHAGDALDPASLEGGLDGCEALINLIGIIREFPGRKVTFERLHSEATRNLVKAALQQGVGRYLQMSANGTRPDAKSDYHRTKWAAEELVRGSGLDWTIFRPSLIYGRGGEFVTMLAAMVNKLPVVPVIGDGRYRMSPVAVEQVAASFCLALEKPATAGQCYACCGGGSYSYDEILDLVGTALGKGKVAKLHQPLFMIKPVVRLLENLPPFPITSTQLTMLLEGNVCDPAPWQEVFGLTPEDFAAGIRRVLG